MENIELKLIDIKKNYFKNIFNQEYINDSYEFLKEIEFFDKVAENEFSIFDNVFSKYSREKIFLNIKEIYKSINDEKFNNSKLSTIEIPLKKKISLFDPKFHQKIEKLLSSNNREIKEEEEVKKEKSENKYSVLVEKFMKLRMEEENRNKEFISKCEKCISYYEREEFIEFLKMIKEDENIMKKLVQDRGERFNNLVKFEETLVTFFLKEVEDKNGYTTIKNSDYKMSYKQGKNDLTIKFEKEIDINIISMLSLIYEVEYFHKWFPFCKQSNCLYQPDKAKKLCYLVNSIPVINDRDFLIYGFGINNMRENNTVLIICRSIHNDSGIFQDYFAKKENKKYVRGEILIFGFELKIINKNKILVKGLMNTDPKVGFIPQWIINQVTQKFAQDLFSKLVKISKNYEGSEYQNKNPTEIDKIFYNFIEDEVKNLNID